MIKIVKNERFSICNSCTSKKNIRSIKVSVNEDGWTSIMLCEKCIAELQKLLREG